VLDQVDDRHGLAGIFAPLKDPVQARPPPWRDSRQQGKENAGIAGVFD